MEIFSVKGKGLPGGGGSSSIFQNPAKWISDWLGLAQKKHILLFSFYDCKAQASKSTNIWGGRQNGFEDLEGPNKKVYKNRHLLVTFILTLLKIESSGLFSWFSIPCFTKMNETASISGFSGGFSVGCSFGGNHRVDARCGDPKGSFDRRASTQKFSIAKPKDPHWPSRGGNKPQQPATSLLVLTAEACAFPRFFFAYSHLS